MTTLYSVRKSKSNLKPHEQGEMVNQFQTYSEAARWIEQQEKPSQYYVSLI